MGTESGEIIIYSLNQSKVLKTLSGSHTGPVRSVVGSSDGGFVFSGSDDGMVVVWDMKNGGVEKR